MRKVYTILCLLATGLCANAQMPPVKWQKAFQTDTGKVIYEPSGAFDQILAPNTDLVDIKALTGGGYMAIVNGRLPLLVKISSSGDTLFTKKLSDMGRKLLPTPDGGVVVLGSNSGSIHGLSGITLCKYNSAGQLVWREEYKGGAAITLAYAKEEPADVLATADGGYLILASSNLLKGNDKSQDPIGPVTAAIAPDYWLIKTDADGLPEWDKTIGGNGADFGNSIINAAGGGYIVAGTSNSPVSGNKTAPQKAIDAQKPSDIWLLKIDNAGNVLWDKTVGSAAEEYYPLMITTKDGGFLVSSTSLGDVSGDKTETSMGSTDSWVIKFSSQGNIQWQKTLGGIYQEAPSSLLELPDAGFLITQTTNSPKSGNKLVESFSSIQELDIWQVKLSSTGSIDWQTLYGGLQSERAPVILQHTDGTMLMASSSNSDISGNKTVSTKSRIMFEGTEYTGGNDVWLIKFDVPSLPVNLLSFTGISSNSYALLHWKTATEINFSHFELEKSFDAQSFSKIATVATKGNASQYNYEDDIAGKGLVYYRLKMVDKDGATKYSAIVSVKAAGATTVSISPNPVSNNQMLVLRMSAATPAASWQIVGVDGKIYASQKNAAGTTQLNIDTRSLAKGYYLLQYKNAGGQQTVRFVKN